VSIAPVSVTCRHCGAAFASVLPVEGED
jgi:hypothetical protein